MDLPLISEFVLSRPALQELWFYYVTFHDPVQWFIMLLIGWTAWGQKKKKQEMHALALSLRKELDHVHDELHTHIEEDSALHADLGQGGMKPGEPFDGDTHCTSS